jgi:hypothetical protein
MDNFVPSLFSLDPNGAWERGCKMECYWMLRNIVHTDPTLSWLPIYSQMCYTYKEIWGNDRMRFHTCRGGLYFCCGLFCVLNKFLAVLNRWNVPWDLSCGFSILINTVTSCFERTLKRREITVFITTWPAPSKNFEMRGSFWRRQTNRKF